MPATGMELPAAIGLTADVIAIVKGCVEGTERIVSFIKMTKKLPQEFSDLDFTLRYVTYTLQSASQFMESDESSAIDVSASMDFLQFCRQGAEDIQTQLSNVLPHLADAKITRAWKAVKSMIKQGHLKSRLDHLRQYTHLLITQQTHAITNAMRLQGREQPQDRRAKNQAKPLRQLSVTSHGRPIVIVIPSPEQMAMDVQKRTGRRVNPTVLDWADDVSSIPDGRPTDQRRKESTQRRAALSIVAEDDEDDPLSSDDGNKDDQADDEPYDHEDSDVTMCASANDLDAIRKTSFLLRHGCSKLLTNPHDARTILRSAAHQTRAIQDNTGPVGVRKFRILTHTAIGLAKCTKPAEPLLEKARLYNHTAMNVASSMSSECERHCDKVRLDAANVHLARSKSAARGSDKRAQYEKAAFDVFSQVVASCEDSCTTVDHCNTHAQALLGCGKLASKASLDSYTAGTPMYLDRALNTIKKAKYMPFPSPFVVKSLKDTEREILAAIGG